jgi:uncharacterized membrane protein (DUF106 family)
MNLNVYIGMTIVIAVLTLLTTIVQKYATDQETLRKIKAEQKEVQEEMKKFRNNPQKIMELNKKQLEKMPQMMEVSMRPLIYTFVPFILFFRWFGDYFASGFKFFGFLSWFWLYIILSIVFSTIFRKILKVV